MCQVQMGCSIRHLFHSQPGDVGFRKRLEPSRVEFVSSVSLPGDVSLPTWQHEQYKKAGSLGNLLGMKSYPVMWGLWNTKPWNNGSLLNNQDSMESKRFFCSWLTWLEDLLMKRLGLFGMIVFQLPTNSHYEFCRYCPQQLVTRGSLDI